jgi:UDP-2,3-diacylglucosamine pyrophosphatase LpxH
MRHVISDQLQQAGNPFRHYAIYRQVEIAAASDRRQTLQNALKRDTFAAENVAMSNLSAFHGKNEPPRNITHIDEVHHEIEVQLDTPAKEAAKHRRRRSQVVIMRSYRHCRSANYHRETGCRSLNCGSFRQHLRTSIRTRHIVGRRQAVFSDII